PQTLDRTVTWLVTVGTRRHQLVAEQVPERGERDEDVRAVADPGDPHALERAEPVADRQRIRERLAWMLVGSQRVDHGDRGPRRPRLELGMLMRPDREHVQVAGERPRRIRQRLAAREL